MVKFWFTAEGKYIANTLVDGITRAGRGTGGSKFSTKLSDYTVGRSISSLSDLRGGEMASMIIGSDEVIAYIFKEGNRYYAIQNSKSGSSPSSNAWKNYGRYSWALGAGEYSNLKLLTPKNPRDLG